MMADELLQRFPRETLRWLRVRLGLSQLALALAIGADLTSVNGWEAGRHRVSRAHRAHLAPLLAPHLATAAGAAFLAALDGGG